MAKALIVRNLDKELVRRLKLRAARHGRSAEAEHRAILEQVLGKLSDLVADALHLAFLLTHPIYDCLYLALAVETGTPVVTADRRFVDAVRRHPALADKIVPLEEVP